MVKVENANKKNSRKSGGAAHISFRGLFAVTAAFAWWIFLLSDLRGEPLVIAFFWTFAIVAGVVGQFIYRYFLPWRGTVVTGLLLFPMLFFTGLAILLSGSEGALDFFLLPIDLFLHQSWDASFHSTIPLFVSVLVLTAAHLVRPSLSGAIISAVGVSLWYATATLIAANAG